MAIMQEKEQKTVFEIEWLIPRARIDYLDIPQGMQTVTQNNKIKGWHNDKEMDIATYKLNGTRG